MEPAPQPTMRELAAAMNISVATVSMALRNHPEIAPETRRRIQAFALERGYRLNPSVAAFMSHVRSSRAVTYRETLGWINPSDRSDIYVNKNMNGQYWQNLWKGAYERAGQLGYALDMCWLKAPNMTGQRMSAILAARGIRGLLIPPIPQACGHLSIKWSEFAVIALSFTIARPQFHRVVPDHHGNMEMILRTLRRRGYRRIGLLLPTRYDERSGNRLRSAFFFYQQSLSVRDRVPVLICDIDVKATCAVWLKRYLPDAVIALKGFPDLRKIDIGDPAYSKRLGIVAMGYNASDVRYTGVDENPYRIGSAAVDHLSGQLNRNELGIPDFAETVLIKGSWVEGETLA